ncbi:Uma2 family endonuclease [Actinoplanes sp. NPDC051861]|uniref:Uma2 family endonuclease n=1 Tax=Actinoplanes sp. NPDC051861 TaxID=3155170 RepID=UPI00344401C4
MIDQRLFTESGFLSLGETSERIELFDGSLHITPRGTPRHQHVSASLRAALPPAGLHILGAVNVRCGTDRITIPDLVIAADIDLDEFVVDASAVRLVCEILSPSNSTTDQVLKKHYYAAAGIPWYLLVDPKSGTMQLFQLDGESYREHSTAAPGVPLRLTEPVDVSIDPADLLPPS